MLKARYVDINLQAVNDGTNNKQSCSVWWLDICSLNNKNSEEVFANNCLFRVGDRFITSFWHSHWIEGGILKDRFPSLYDISLLQDVSIASLRGWRNGSWCWNDFGIPPAAASRTPAVLLLLQRLLPADFPSRLGHDSVDWMLFEDQNFLVSISYRALCKRYIPFGFVKLHDFAFSSIWKVDVPLTVRAFGWRCFWNRIPTKDLLNYRGIISSSSNLHCVFCNAFPESSCHSFLDCYKVIGIWKDIAGWLGLCYSKLTDFKESYLFWSSSCRNLKIKKGKVGSVRLVVVWSLWLCRNDIIFKDVGWNASGVAWSCKALLWR
ncbi:uncharacterized protein LOC131597441 [Vicia villosa]|uniref:uncharacterized protein LOC131597441 n=1 Tax=Vicia villosa TaxID=3911 RepID=UPI00273ADBE1|nr:uncharacterized protein LOC131597441 [Vicia villosa]